MKNIDELKELATVAGDETRGAPERVAAFRECDAGRKEAKLGWSKLGLQPDQAQALRTSIEALDGSDVIGSPSGSSGKPGDSFEATGDELSGQSGRPTVEDARAEADGEAVVQAKAKAKAKKDPATGEPRGGLTRLVESLLMDARLSYLDIIKAVITEYPKASTSARSIASVAAAMRRKGTQVPMRRPIAAEKPAKEAAKAA